MVEKRIFDLSPIEKKLACPNHALDHPIGFLTPKLTPRGYFWPTKNFEMLILNCQDIKTQC